MFCTKCGAQLDASTNFCTKCGNPNASNQPNNSQQVQVVGSDTNEVLKYVLPVGRSGLAIAAGYVAIFSMFMLPAPLALILGILALRDIKSHPGKLGKGRAYFAIVVGGIFTLLFCIVIIKNLVS